MCGIGGVLFQRPGVAAPVRGHAAPRWCDTLSRALQHRGPDGTGTFIDDGVALVHTRLSMRDPHAGAQPLSTPDARYSIVVNGELYDDSSLRARLSRAGAQFRTRSDSEVLLWTLALFGPAGLNDVEGEYAFCFWDGRARRAWLGRDPLGVKPLVYSEHAGATWFASEAKALRAVVPRPFPLDPEVVVESLVAPALSGGTATPFLGMHAVPAGVTLAIQQHATQVARHRCFSLAAASQQVSAEALASALHSAVCDRMQADAPVGVFLSGGVDSSAIVAAARQVVARVPCFSIRFDHHQGGASYQNLAGSIVLADDAPFADNLSQRWLLDLTRVHTSQQALMADIEGLVASQDRIVAWEQELSQRALARAAAERVKAVLVGDAADETHYGYAFALEADVCRSPGALLARFGFSARRALLRPEHQARADALDTEYRALCRAAGTAYTGELAGDRLATAQLLVQRWLPRLMHNGDLHTMAAGVEARVPFADGRVLGLAAQVSPAQGFRPYLGPPEKALLRAAVRPWLPESIIRRPKSALPRDERLGPLLARALAARLATADGRERLALFLDLPALRSLLERAEPYDDTSRACLFSVLAFEGFLRHHSR